jgi:hypothetical protein
VEPLCHQDIAGTCRSKDGRAERGSMSLRSMGVWISFVGVWNSLPSGENTIGTDPPPILSFRQLPLVQSFVRPK